MTLLAETIHVLTRTHIRRTTNTEGETIYGEEPALLDILEDCVASTTGSKAGGGGGRGTPVDLGALDLAAEIKRTTQEHWPVQGVLKAPLRLRVNAWYANTHDPNEALTMLDTASRWEDQIREMIEPTRKFPLPDVACPLCKHTETLTELDGERTYKPILMAYPSQGETKVVCTSSECSGEWRNEEIEDTFKTGLHL